MKLKMVLLMFTLGVMLNVPSAVYGATTNQDTSYGYSCAQDDDVSAVDSTAVVSMVAYHTVPSVEAPNEVYTAKSYYGLVSEPLSRSRTTHYGIYDDYGERTRNNLNSGFTNNLKEPPSDGSFVFRRSRDGLIQS